jgi:hypothetical protein
MLLVLCCPDVLAGCRLGVFDPLVKEVASPQANCWDPLDAAALATYLFDLGARVV